MDEEPLLEIPHFLRNQRNLVDEGILKDGEPCSHKGCLHHITHPCESCGRIAGIKS